MSGHSKWSTIKHKKAAADSKRGKVFTKLIKALTVAAREGGGDPESNSSLRIAIDKARQANMPKDSIDRAIKRGTGELDGGSFENVTYEGYGPSGVAIIIECLTDNRNRTVAEIRHMFAKANGNLGQDGCVAWMFDVVGQIAIQVEHVEDEDTLMLAAIEAGAEDVHLEDDQYLITCPPETLHQLKSALAEAGFEELEQAEIVKVPRNTVEVTGKEAVQVYNLLMKLEEHDDIEQVSANCDLDESSLDSL